MVRWTGEIKPDEPEVIDVGDGKEETVSRRATLFLSSGSFLLSLLFLSQNITGNVVGGFSTNGANWIGAVFFVMAIGGFLFYIFKRK